MPPDTTKSQVSGVTEACLYNDHSGCHNPRCGCSCHNPTPAPSPTSPTSNGNHTEMKACPKCGTKRPANEMFCRLDGERLASLLCKICGKGMEVEDKYCWGCGAPAGTQSPIELPIPGPILPVPILPGPVEQPVANYEAQVLRDLQEELANANQTESTPKDVEKPMGVQGTFTITSRKPIPRLRVGEVIRTDKGEPIEARGPRPSQAIKLPIKPE
jgi:hypothetical protein